MKNIIIAVLGITLAFMVAKNTYSNNSKIIAEQGSEWTAYKIFDGDTRCYIVMGASGYAGERPVSISCVRVK